MIIATTDPEKEDLPSWAPMGKRKWRWTLRIGIHWLWWNTHFPYMEVEHEYQMENDSKWHPTGSHFGWSFRPFYWSREYDSAYYDGTWHHWAFGPIHLTWMS
jgi:hypothetical protein